MSDLNPDRRARLHLRTAQAWERVQVTNELVGALAMHYRDPAGTEQEMLVMDNAVRSHSWIFREGNGVGRER